ncbi:DUF1048 domain-containing protein [Lacticaseibacillus zhaodongensis]|uniref:DUF1048 domain-containing protein n=1 Tax=Lacticaseibacillus zhaodongensis TaxID=2668065 RepID=UPI0012D2F6DE|nr:DUF1048 domain-containing protein [Lacticaseibacillus zhaodongensis]
MNILDSKAQWRAHMAAVHALPADYQKVYKLIQNYLFKAGVSRSQAATATALSTLLELFQAGAARQADVLAVTGDDVAAFADGLLQA